MEVKRSMSVAQNARRNLGESYFKASRGISVALRDLVCKGNLFRHKEKMTMSTKITMALVAAVIAYASPALAGGNRNRDNEYTYKTAQYCLPQLDDLPDTTRVFC
jgi:hypothetical protein